MLFHQGSFRRKNMSKFGSLAFGAALSVSATFLAGSVASALPVSAVSSPIAAAAINPLIEKVQVRRRFVGARPVVGRRGGRGGIGLGGAAVGLGILGIAAAAAAANSQPEYVEGPACYFERRPVHDRFGNYIGTRRIRVCE
jgi:hypothetical protein